MRALADEARIRAFLRALGPAAKSPARVYLTGGATAVLHGWRASTLDVDIKLVPDASDVLQAIPALKESLQINVELASPDLFIPVAAGWEERSVFEVQEGSITCLHFDLHAQALAKIERGHVHDLQDVAMMFERKLIAGHSLHAYFESIRPELFRFPAIDPPSFAGAVSDAIDRAGRSTLP